MVSSSPMAPQSINDLQEGTRPRDVTSQTLSGNLGRKARLCVCKRRRGPGCFLLRDQRDQSPSSLDHVNMAWLVPGGRVFAHRPGRLSLSLLDHHSGTWAAAFAWVFPPGTWGSPLTCDCRGNGESGWGLVCHLQNEDTTLSPRLMWAKSGNQETWAKWDAGVSSTVPPPPPPPSPRLHHHLQHRPLHYLHHSFPPLLP